MIIVTKGKGIEKMIHMKQLTSKEEWAESYPIMSELRTELDIETYLQRLEACVQKESYMLFALYENTAIRALCGLCREFPFIKESTCGLRILLQRHLADQRDTAKCFWIMPQTGREKPDLVLSVFHLAFSVKTHIDFIQIKWVLL